jgi:membrane protease YdiL (CAAX protease family)
MFTGIPFGVLEYYVLTPAPIASDLSIVGFVLLAIAFIFATGFAEELVFRGILQNNAIKLFGPKVGLIAVSAVFAALHIGWLNLMDVTLVFVIGLIFGIFMYKTGSLAGVSLSHGLTNVFLFIVMPYLVNLINGLSSR